MDVVRLNSSDHILHLESTPYVYSTNGAEMRKCVEGRRLALRVGLRKEANDRNDTLIFNGLEALLESSRATNFNDVIHASTTGEFLCGLPPAWITLVVDNVVCTKLLQFVCLFGAGSRGDYSGTGSFGELQKANGNVSTENDNTIKMISHRVACHFIPAGQKC